MATYDIGDTARLTGAFTTALGVAIDPTAVTLKIQRLGGTTTTLVYGVDVAVIKDSTGDYHYDYLLSASGTYRYEWTGTGAAAASEPGDFVVRRNAITGA